LINIIHLTWAKNVAAAIRMVKVIIWISQ